MEKRPAFRKYAGYFPAFMIKRPVKIDGMYYTFKDYPMLLMGNILIIAAMFFVYAFSPITPDPSGAQAMSLASTLGIMLTAAYWLFIAYLIGRFHIQSVPADHIPYLDYAKVKEMMQEKEKPSENEHKEAWKSRRAFAVYVILFSMLATLYCTVLYTPAPVRLYDDHKQDLQRLAEIALKYDRFYIQRGDKPGESEMWGSISPDLSRNQLEGQEAAELTRLFNNLQKDAVFTVERWDFVKSKALVVYLIHKNNIYRIIYKETENQEQGASPRGDGLWLDDHWWWVD